MGMYTEIYTKIEFVKDLPSEAIAALKWLDGQELEGLKLPEHPFFSLPRAEYLLMGSSYYHQPEETRNLWFDNIGENWYLCSRSDIKNYDGEIAAFFDWVKPYCAGSGKTFIGYFLYEEEVVPTLVFAREDEE